LFLKHCSRLYGDYKALTGGLANEALEDMTGGVSSVVNVPDILDSDHFWNEELMNVKKDRLFGCYLWGIKPEWGSQTLVNGAYLVIRAVETPFDSHSRPGSRSRILYFECG
jgi:hypothetical protein